MIALELHKELFYVLNNINIILFMDVYILNILYIVF